MLNCGGILLRHDGPRAYNSAAAPAVRAYTRARVEMCVWHAELAICEEHEVEMS